MKSGALSAQHKLVYKDGEDEWVAFPDASLVVSKEKPTEKPEEAASTGAAAAAPGGGKARGGKRGGQ